jgi:hypothetical protein
VGLPEHLSAHPLDCVGEGLQIGKWVKLGLSWEPQAGSCVPVGYSEAIQAVDTDQACSVGSLELCIQKVT